MDADIAELPMMKLEKSQRMKDPEACQTRLVDDNVSDKDTGGCWRMEGMKLEQSQRMKDPEACQARLVDDVVSDKDIGGWWGMEEMIKLKERVREGSRR